YTQRESAVIGSTFSVVSLTFTLVVIAEVNLGHMFIPFYLTVLFAGLIAALIMPRIPPLSRYSNKYIKDTTRTIDETVPSDMNSVIFGYQKALERVKQATSVYQFLKNDFQNVLDK